MVLIEIERIIRAPRDRVFALVSDFEGAPKLLPDYVKDVKILRREGNEYLLEEELVLAGRRVRQVSRHILEPSFRHRVEVLEGDAKGTVSEELYTDIPEGTKLQVKADVKLAGVLKFMEVLGKGMLKSAMERTIDEFVKVAEREARG